MLSKRGGGVFTVGACALNAALFAMIHTLSCYVLTSCALKEKKYNVLCSPVSKPNNEVVDPLLMQGLSVASNLTSPSAEKVVGDIVLEGGELALGLVDNTESEIVFWF